MICLDLFYSIYFPIITIIISTILSYLILQYSISSNLLESNVAPPRQRMLAGADAPKAQNFGVDGEMPKKGEPSHFRCGFDGNIDGKYSIMENIMGNINGKYWNIPIFSIIWICDISHYFPLL